jgi:hypothetical protein
MIISDLALHHCADFAGALTILEGCGNDLCDFNRASLLARLLRPSHLLQRIHAPGNIEGACLRA